MSTPVRTSLAAAATAVAATVAMPAAALAQSGAEYNGGEDQGVLPAVVEQERPANRSSTTVTGSTPSTLPFTGGELVLVAASGAVAVGAGVLMVMGGRRRAPQH